MKMMKFNKYLLIAMVGVVLAISPVVAGLSITNYTNRIFVVDSETGIGIPDAVVGLYLDTSSDIYNPLIEYVSTTTDSEGYAYFDIGFAYYNIIVVVSAEGYTSSNSAYGFSYYSPTIYEMITTVNLFPGEPIPSQTTYGDLTVTVQDGFTETRLSDVFVYLFEGEVNTIALPEQATFSKVTDVNGQAVFNSLRGTYYVGIIAESYTSDRTVTVNPNDQNEVVYSYWGFCGVAQDLEYKIDLYPIGSQWYSFDPIVLVSQVSGGLLAAFGLINWSRGKK